LATPARHAPLSTVHFARHVNHNMQDAVIIYDPATGLSSHQLPADKAALKEIAEISRANSIGFKLYYKAGRPIYASFTSR